MVPGEPCDVEGATQACYPGSPTTRAIGECHDGTSRCTDGSWADCVGSQIPTSEACNDLDDNCNGVVDDGCGSGGAAGAGGMAGGGGSGASGGGSPSLRLYHRNFANNAVAFSANLATDVWTGANAPAPDAVVAVEASYGTTDPWLFVVSTDGFVYLRRAGVWLVPQPFAATFVGLDVTTVNSLSIWQPAAQGPQTFQFTGRSGGTQKLAYDFQVALPALTVTPSADNPIVIPDDSDPSAPPHYMVDLDWSFSHQTAHLGTPQWVLFYMQCGVNAYLLDGGNFAWADLGPADQSFLWGGDPSAGPAATTVRAAWLEGSEIYLLAP